MNENYTYKTMIMSDEEPVYTYAEVRYGKIVSINKHWLPKDEFKKLFEPNAFFLDITGVLIEGEVPAIGDVVNTSGHGYEIIHIKRLNSNAEIKNRKIEMLKLTRDRIMLSTIDVEGRSYDADLLSYVKLKSAQDMLTVKKTVESIDWTLADNTHYDITARDIDLIVGAIEQRTGEIHVRYSVLKEYINNLEDRYISIVSFIDWNWDINTDLDKKLDEINGVKRKAME